MLCFWALHYEASKPSLLGFKVWALTPFVQFLHGVPEGSSCRPGLLGFRGCQEGVFGDSWAENSWFFFFWGGDGSSSFSTGPLDRARLPLPVLPRPPCCFPGQVVAGLGFVMAGGRESQPPGGKEANTPRLKQNVEMQSCLNLVPQWKLKQNALRLCVLLRLRAAAFPRATSAGEYWPPTPHVPKTPAS